MDRNTFPTIPFIPALAAALLILIMLAVSIPALTGHAHAASRDETGVSAAPVLPMQLTVSPSAEALYNDKVRLTWQAAEGVTGYMIYRDAHRIGVIRRGSAAANTMLSFTDRHLKPGSRHRYSVRPFLKPGEVTIYGVCSAPVSVRVIHRDPRILMVDDREDEKVILPRQLRKAGCTVKIVHSLDKVDPAKYDGLVVPGGGDVDPSLWGGSKHPAAGPFTPKTDRFQIRAIKRFAKAGKPILGICRGGQLINVAFGGTMIQNLYPDSRTPTYEEGYHQVKNEEGSWVAGIYGDSPKVWFHHHQAVDRPGKGIRITSWSVDHPYRHAEAIEHESLPIYGVQWHPDYKIKEQGTAIFSAFKDVCLKYMAR